MFMNLIYILLNTILLLNLFSFYNNFFLSVEILLFLLFVFIVLNIFKLSFKFLSLFLIQQKNIIIEEYYNKFFDFYYFLDYYKLYLNLYLKNIIYNIILLKYFLFFCKSFLNKKLIFFKNILSYLVNNLLHIFFNQNILLKKIKINFYLKYQLKNFLFLKFYSNLLKPTFNKWISNI